MKCSKCKGVWYCSKECQKKHWPIHKSGCHEVERSSGALKLIQIFSANPTLMGHLKVGIVLDSALLENPRVGFDMPFLARVDIAIEPSEILDFIGLYLNNRLAGEKLRGMVQVNALSVWNPSTHAPLTPMRQRLWREARAKYNAKGFARDPVGLIEFINCAENSATAELHIPSFILDAAKKREPFLCASALTPSTQFEKPMNAATCIEYINLHIRADKQNQLLLHTEMTEQDKEIIRAAGRNEDTLPAVLLKSKMGREHLYTNIVKLPR
ncbi:hypothetical protein K503DRAFT_856970 [Rhizopogon vinicolor AM-OR11-026]|uniref:MYND-type domain-containing protein n=1 Tax=Rhizopogon vinicolor AM-OR11-026 TaxID=1314800 RepID=A0A1B7MZP9_9AGAM|nr:hypothetical protein K503DRAFT_856970 [Rhizopogon vinicolor AM-OR11-026]